MNRSPESTDQPEILEAHWDREQIDALFDDLRRGAVVEHVQVRCTAHQGSDDVTVTLDQAKQLLDDGQAGAIQIRYVFEDQNWCDTLMVLPHSIRIIRTSLPAH